GFTVIIGSRDEARGRAATDALRTEGIQNVEAIRFDVNRPEDHNEAARYLERRFGKLDVLVNNAGVHIEEADFGNPDGFNTTSKTTQAELRRTFDTNFFAVVGLTQALLPLLRKAPAGRIVNLSSILGSLALHSELSSPIYSKKSFAYDASKTALSA